jgi:hypothetical protein
LPPDFLGRKPTEGQSKKRGGWQNPLAERGWSYVYIRDCHDFVCGHDICRVAGRIDDISDRYIFEKKITAPGWVSGYFK